jgi:hypothetical protein
MEFLRVPLVVQERVLEKREHGAVGGRELAKEEVASVEEVLEQVEGGGQLTAQRSDPLLIGSLLAPLDLDLIRGALPDAVEPVEEDVQLGAASRLRRNSGGSGVAASR